MKIDGNPVMSLERVLQDIVPDGMDGRLPPVEDWNPGPHRDIQMEIRRDGSWWHEGRQIKREPLVKLFSRILRKDPDGGTYLVTPYEKVIVHVEDAPFLAVRVDRAGEPGPDQVLAFKTNLGDVTLAGPDALLRVETDPVKQAPAPYIHVRGRLEAKLTRPVFYELANISVRKPGDDTLLGVWSQGMFFELGPSA